MFSDFLSAHKKNIIVWLIVCAVFAVVFSLYELPLAPVLYGAVLSGFFGVVFIATDFVYYRRKRTALQRLADEITLSAENIPLPQNGIEGDYTKLIHTLYDSLKAAENEAAEEAEAKAQIKLQSKELYGEFVNAARSVSGSVTLCPMCGASVTDGSRFCGNCGTKLC